jgi:hypothetical protein
MTFFERAWPGFDRRAMHTELDRLRAGFDHPRVARSSRSSSRVSRLRCERRARWSEHFLRRRAGRPSLD